MARAWHIANGHLATGEKDGGHVVILLRLEEAQARALSHTQREVLDQLEHAAMPFLERTSTGAAGLVVTPSGRRRFGFILNPDELVLIDDGDVCAIALGRAVEDRARVEGPAGAFCCCATTPCASLACMRTLSSWSSGSSRVASARIGAR